MFEVKCNLEVFYHGISHEVSTIYPRFSYMAQITYLSPSRKMKVESCHLVMAFVPTNLENVEK